MVPKNSSLFLLKELSKTFGSQLFSWLSSFTYLVLPVEPGEVSYEKKLSSHWVSIFLSIRKFLNVLHLLEFYEK